jgi:hypothetical protein
MRSQHSFGRLEDWTSVRFTDRTLHEVWMTPGVSLGRVVRGKRNGA